MLLPKNCIFEHFWHRRTSYRQQAHGIVRITLIVKGGVNTREEKKFLKSISPQQTKYKMTPTQLLPTCISQRFPMLQLQDKAIPGIQFDLPAQSVLFESQHGYMEYCYMLKLALLKKPKTSDARFKQLKFNIKPRKHAQSLRSTRSRESSCR